MTKQLRQDSPQEIGMTATLTIPDDYLRAMEDRIVERLFNKLKPLFQEHASEESTLTIDEAALFMKKSKAQIYQWANNARHGLGDFPYFKSGRSLRFSKKALIEWMERNAKKR